MTGPLETSLGWHLVLVEERIGLEMHDSGMSRVVRAPLPSGGVDSVLAPPDDDEPNELVAPDVLLNVAGFFALSYAGGQAIGSWATSIDLEKLRAPLDDRDLKKLAHFARREGVGGGEHERDLMGTPPNGGASPSSTAASASPSPSEAHIEIFVGVRGGCGAAGLRAFGGGMSGSTGPFRKSSHELHPLLAYTESGSLGTSAIRFSPLITHSVHSSSDVIHCARAHWRARANGRNLGLRLRISALHFASSRAREMRHAPPSPPALREAAREHSAANSANRACISEHRATPRLTRARPRARAHSASCRAKIGPR